MSLCKYKNIFGMPNQGAHKERIFGLALVDVALTIILAGLISYVTKINVVKVLLSLVIIAIIIHRLFCVNTALNVKIFGKVN